MIHGFHSFRYEVGLPPKMAGAPYSCISKSICPLQSHAIPLSFPASLIDGLRQRGTMAVWINPKVPKPVAYEYGFFALIGEPNAPHPCERGRAWIVWGDEVTHTGFVGGVNFSNVVNGHPQMAITPDEPEQYTATPGVPFHAAIVWDIDGIDGTQDTVRVYRDGNIVGRTSSSWVQDGSRQQDIHLGEGPDSGGYDKFITDNIVIYDYAKTDFSDRYNENPLTPMPLHATAVSPTAIRLSWNDNFTSELGFRIEIKDGNCSSMNPWEIRADVGAETVTFLDRQLLPSPPYSYQFRTYCGGGNFSSYSQCASATTGTAGTPHIPTHVRAFSKSNTRVNLRWHDTSTDETAFEIYRQAGSGSWTLLDTVVGGIESYTDTTATGNYATTTYYYDVRACNASGCSVPPNTPLLVPFRPVNLAVSVASTVHLTWKDKSSNESGFEIHRKNAACESQNPWILVHTVAAHTQAYDDSSAVPATVYSYKVRSYHATGVMPQAFGYSKFTKCVSVTTP